MSGRAAAALARWWVALYTAMVDTEVAGRRRLEVASDVWEQQAARRGGRGTGTWSIVRRVVTGVPADLSWARRQRSLARAMGGASAARIAAGAAARWWWVVAGVGVAVVYAVATVALWLEPGRPHAEQSVVLVPAAVAICVGVMLRARGHRLAGVPIAVGALFAAMLVWAWPLALTAWLAIVGATADAAASWRPRR